MRVIILAAGMGTRLKPFTDKYPKCFAVVNNEFNIVHTLKLLEEKNISDITIVTGHLAKQFDYLTNFFNIKLVHNNEYATTNSITSMKCAIDSFKGKMDDTIVLDGDIYIDNVNVIDTSFKHSGYSVIDHEDLKEWQVYSSFDNRIYKIDREFLYDKRNNHPILDISYWTKKEFKWLSYYLHMTDNTQKYWDEIPCLDYFNCFDLYAYHVSPDSVGEYDTVEELRALQKKFGGSVK